MSPTRAVALVVTAIAIAARALIVALEVAAHEQIVARGIGSLITITIFIAWTSFLGLQIQETLRAHSADRAQDVLDAIAAALDQACDSAAVDARLDLMRRLEHSANTTQAQPHGHVNSRPKLVN